MKPVTRRHRDSDTPLGRRHIIASSVIPARYVRALLFLEPYHFCKYATAPWLHFLVAPKIEYSVFRKYLGYLREEPNRHVGCPEQQKASPNTNYKHLVYELRERGLNELIQRGLASKRTRLDAEAAPIKKRRNRSFATHRANSYYHEIIVDLGYYLPLRHLIASDPALRLIDLSQLLQHKNVPLDTRHSRDPLLIKLRDAEMRFDGTPHIIGRTASAGEEYFLCVPGIQVDRGTETFATVEQHILHAIEFVTDRHYVHHWGFDSCIIPFLFTKRARLDRALEFVQKQRGNCSFLLFHAVPDLGLEPHFPHPRHYDPNYRYRADEWVPPQSIHIFTKPWQRAGHPDFDLRTLGGQVA